MPYDSNEELPSRIRRQLPPHVCTIYRMTYNTTFEKYKDTDEHIGNRELDDIADKAAWTAVEEAFTKEGDEWVRKEES